MNIDYKKNHKKVGIIIAILNMLAILNGAYYFLFMAKFPIAAWFFFNICAPSTTIFLIGFFLDNKAVMTASIPFLAFFGGAGLFVFGWTGTSIYAQIGHILMVTAIAYTIFVIILEKKWKQALLGLLIGILIFSLFLPFQQEYVKDHPEYIKKLNDPSFEKFVQQKDKEK